MGTLSLDSERTREELSCDEVSSMGLGGKDKAKLKSIFGECTFVVEDGVFHIEVPAQFYLSDNFKGVLCDTAKTELQSERTKQITGRQERIRALHSADRSQSKSVKQMGLDFDVALIWQVYYLMHTERADFEVALACAGQMHQVQMSPDQARRIKRNVDNLANYLFSKKNRSAQLKKNEEELATFEGDISDGEVIGRAKKILRDAQKSLEKKVNQYLELRQSPEWLEGKLAKNRVAGRRRNLGGAEGISLRNHRVRTAVHDILDQDWPDAWSHNAMRRVESNM